MDAYICLIIIGILYGFLFFTDTILKSCMNKPYYMFLQGTGLSFNFGRINWYTTSLNRTVVKWASRKPQFLNGSFDVGVWVSVVLLPIIFVWHFAWTFVHHFNSKTTDANGFSSKTSSDMGLEIMVPGVNLPADEIGYYICALGMCSIIHELGHALAAVLVEVPVTGFGFHLMLVFPVAYTEINTDRLNALKLWHKLRVLTAGIWHNILLALVCYLWFVSLPTIFLPFYATNSGVIVTSVSQKSPVSGYRGLVSNDIVQSINGCPVRNVDDWYGCLLQTIRQPPAYCVSSDFILNNDESIPLFHTEDGTVECCDPKYTKNVCFERESEEDDQISETPQHMCLEARRAIEKSDVLCQGNSAICSKDSFCVRPMLNNSTTIIQIRRKNNKSDMIYIGHPADISTTVKVSIYIPKTSIINSQHAESISLFLRYVIVFSLGLAFVNALPCYSFDGQHIVSALVHHGLQNIVPERSKRDLIAIGATCIGTTCFAAGIFKIAYTNTMRYI